MLAKGAEPECAFPATTLKLDIVPCICNLSRGSQISGAYGLSLPNLKGELHVQWETVSQKNKVYNNKGRHPV